MTTEKLADTLAKQQQRKFQVGPQGLSAADLQRLQRQQREANAKRAAADSEEMLEDWWFDDHTGMWLGRDRFGRDVSRPATHPPPGHGDPEEIERMRRAERKRAFEKRADDAGFATPVLSPDELDQGQRAIFDEITAAPLDVLFHGRAGTGKTSLALAGLLEWYHAGKSVKVARMRTFKRELEAGDYGASPYDALDDFCFPDFLLLDDLGVGTGRRQEGATPHEVEILRQLHDTRSRQGKRTWITTNLTLEPRGGDLLAKYGEALISRLTDRRSAVVRGFDQRKNRRWAQPEKN